MKNTRLFWQVFFPALLIIVSSISATTWIGTHMIRSFYYEQIQEDIEDRALLIRPHVLHLLAAEDGRIQVYCRQNGRSAATRITVIDSDGTVLADSNENPAEMDNHGSRPEILAALNGSIGSSLRFSKTLGQNMVYVAIPLQEDKPGAGVLRLSVPATAVETVLSSIHKKIILGALLIALLAAWLSYYLARRISKPLEEMRRGAEQLAAGKVDQPIILQDANISQETAELARSLNNMAEQVNNRIKIIIQQRNELEAVFSSMTDGVLAIGADHHIIRINKAAAALFHIDDLAVEGKPMEGVLRNIHLQAFISRALAREESVEKNLILLINGQELTLRTRAVRLLDGEGESMGILVIINNLTRINWLENIRQDFVANVSHELKTPITAIRGYVETLLDGAMDASEQSKKFLEIIDRQGSRLDAIVDDLLSLARIENRAEKDDISFQQENIRPILETARQSCTIQAEQKGVAIAVECDPMLMGAVNRTMLEQAIINLLTNAVTHSPEGTTVRMEAFSHRDSTGKETVSIKVQDQGPGIAPEHLDRIFERFYRCDKARSRKDGGTGLGLAIVKHIAQCHGGTVDVSSSRGSGATFTLNIPVER